MANVLIEESTMSNIANAIRSKTGKSETILPKDMPKEIEGIKVSGGSDGLFEKIIDDSISGKVKLTAKNIRKYVLAYTANITEIEAVNLTDVSEYAFYFSSLTKIILVNPNIGELAFAGSKITDLVLKGSKVANLLGTRVFVTTPIEKKIGYIYVPKSLIEQYKTATNWVTYATQFRAIEDYPDIAGGI